MNSWAIPAELSRFPPNIRNNILSESGLTRRASQLEKKIWWNLTNPPESIKNQFVAIRAIRGLCGIGV